MSPGDKMSLISATNCHPTKTKKEIIIFHGELDVQQSRQSGFVRQRSFEGMIPALYSVKYKHRLWHLTHI